MMFEGLRTLSPVAGNAAPVRIPGTLDEIPDPKAPGIEAATLDGIEEIVAGANEAIDPAFCNPL
jgi:hypothetical protein